MIKKVVLILCFFTTLLTNLIGQTKESIDSLIQRKIKETGIIGLSAAIIIDKKLVWKNGYGYADKEKGLPFKSSTIMNIGSIAKTFTGLCVMKLVQDGLLNLDEDINSYLPFKVVNPNFPGEKITLRQLATHTSSLADRYPFYNETIYIEPGKVRQPLGSFLHDYYVLGGRYYSKENFLPHKPGTYRDYSNIGAALAGYIVELKSGKTLNKLSKEIIFKPLGMKSSGWFLNEVKINKHSKLYRKTDSDIELLKLYEQITYPDGGVRTSVDDLSKFFICLLNDGRYDCKQILNTETAREMTRFQYSDKINPSNVDPKQLNSGIFWATKQGGTRIGHNGSDPGVRTFMLSDLDKEIAIVMLVNTSLPDKEEIKFFEIQQALYQMGKSIKQKANQ